MKLKMFAFFDAKAGFFSVPFFFHHRGQAVRVAIDLGSDLSTQVGRHPTDFTLFELGEFDDQTGHTTSEPPMNLGVVAGFLPPDRPMPLFDPGTVPEAAKFKVVRPNGPDTKEAV